MGGIIPVNGSFIKALSDLWPSAKTLGFRLSAVAVRHVACRPPVLGLRIPKSIPFFIYKFSIFNGGPSARTSARLLITDDWSLITDY
jgi:hypothetical protein